MADNTSNPYGNIAHRKSIKTSLIMNSSPNITSIERGGSFSREGTPNFSEDLDSFDYEALSVSAGSAFESVTNNTTANTPNRSINRDKSTTPIKTNGQRRNNHTNLDTPVKPFKRSENDRNESAAADESQSTPEHHVTPPETISQNNTIPLQTETTSTNSSNCSLFWSVSTGMGICAVIIAIVLYVAPSVKLETPQCSFDSLKAEFPNEDDMLWKSFRLSVKSVLDEEKQSVILLAYSGTEPPKRLIDAIVNTTVYCMSGEDAIKLDYRDFSAKELITDYGVVVSRLREPLRKHKVLLINDVNKISAIVAQAFHTICDTVTPLVARSVIIFTMHIDPIPQSAHLLQVVEKQLQSDWAALDMNLLQPLLARVTDQVLLLSATS